MLNKMGDTVGVNEWMIERESKKREKEKSTQTKRGARKQPSRARSGSNRVHIGLGHGWVWGDNGRRIVEGVLGVAFFYPPLHFPPFFTRKWVAFQWRRTKTLPFMIIIIIIIKRWYSWTFSKLISNRNGTFWPSKNGTIFVRFGFWPIQVRDDVIASKKLDSICHWSTWTQPTTTTTTTTTTSTTSTANQSKRHRMEHCPMERRDEVCFKFCWNFLLFFSIFFSRRHLGLLFSLSSFLRLRRAEKKSVSSWRYEDEFQRITERNVILFQKWNWKKNK